MQPDALISPSSNFRIAPMTRRHGFTLLELTAATAMLALLLTTSAQMLRVLSAHGRATSQRAIALQAAQAISEEVSNLPWDQLTTEAADQAKVPAQLDPRLPGSKLTLTVVEETTPAISKRITLELVWNGTNGQAVAPVRLTSWAFRD
jgi:prepilin-type N-terminal cleavage/methylation domain-containing protein